MKKFATIAAAAFLTAGVKAQDATYDVVVYGGTSAGITAAIEAAKLGKSVVMIEPSGRIGGLTTGGLGDTDVGNKKSIGGLAIEFYQRIGKKYGQEKAAWFFEPKVALAVYEEMLQEAKVPVVKNERLKLKDGVEKSGTTISAITMESGKVYHGKVFIDATYEGDLMAGAGVSYFIGREPNSQYGETINGIRPGNELPKGIDPYKVPGDPKSGLIARVNANSGGKEGDGDTRLQAYNFRMCLTNDPKNRVMIEKPEGYKEEDYELLFRAIEKGQKSRFFKFREVPNHKTDSNNDSGVSTDYIGMNYDYPDADYATRDKIRKEHEIYQKGLVWTVQNHPRVPQEIRDAHKDWGLPLDEFTESGHWPTQLYVRESRRMVSDFVITENVVLSEEPTHDSIGMGSYAMDSHHTQYCVSENGFVRTEGGMYKQLKHPYPISYRAIVPKNSQCDNLLVPICLSASHAAYGSARMEPVFMILGQSAGAAAALAINDKVSVQDVPYDQLRKILDGDKQILVWTETTKKVSK